MKLTTEKYELEVMIDQYVYFAVLDDRGEAIDSVYIEWNKLNKEGLAQVWKQLDQVNTILSSYKKTEEGYSPMQIHLIN